MPSPSAITTCRFERGGAIVLAISGDVDLATAAQFRTAVDDIVEGCPAAMVIDLSAVSFLASAGLQILTMACQKLCPASRFAVVADGPATSRPIQMTELGEVFALYPTLVDALDDLSKDRTA